MSMYRQLWLAILLSAAVALAGSLVATIVNTRAYLQQQLTLKNEDNAAALALSVSQANPTPAMAELAVSALFDSGHYESIQIVAPDGRIIVEKKTTDTEGEHPWLEKLIPLTAQPGKAQITNGWKQFGTVTLISHTRFAYRALWNTLMELMAALLVAGAIGGLLGWFILRRIKQSLDRVVEQAVAIREKRFIMTSEVSRVPELQQLALAMNETVARLKTIFHDEAKKLETLQHEACTDSVTGIANRQFFLSTLEQMLEDEDSAVDHGALLLLRVEGLAELNKKLGWVACDELLRRIGETMRRHAQHYANGAAAGRLNGGEFALVYPHCADGLPLAQALLDELLQETEALADMQNRLLIGVSVFDAGMTVQAVLSQADGALADAALIGTSAIRVGSDRPVASRMPLDHAGWAAQLSNGLQQQQTKLAQFPLVGRENRLIHMECPLRLRFAPDEPWQAAGKFIPMAEQLGMTDRVDLESIRLGLEILQSDAHLAGVAINVSASSFSQADFVRQVLQQLDRASSCAQRLWIDVNAAGALNHLAAFKHVVAELKRTGIHLGLEHFGHQISRFGEIYGIGLDYLKIDASFIRDIDQHAGNQALLQGTVSMAHHAGLQVYAEGVKTAAEYQTVLALDVDGATGPLFSIA